MHFCDYMSIMNDCFPNVSMKNKINIAKQLTNLKLEYKQYHLVRNNMMTINQEIVIRQDEKQHLTLYKINNCMYY